jgi:predicted O-methyltransferase YrrM
MKTLDSIAIKNKTDKSSLVHNYCSKYEKWLPMNRLEDIKILEIGVYKGSSLISWKEFYPYSTVIGIDIEKECKNSENPKQNIFVEVGSQIDQDFLSFVCSKWGPFDMILDDGSHKNSHVIESFNSLFSSLKEGGVYVIEDACTSYWDGPEEFGGGMKNANSSVEFFKNLVDEVNFNGELHENPDLFIYARREEDLVKKVKDREINIRTDIESINFMNSIIIITKNNLSYGA